MFWNATDRFSALAANFIITIILARILMPEDYGLIGMLSIFIAISQCFVDSGMNSGLIQKKDVTDEDFSTVYVFNLIVSITFYLILFFSSPLIAAFYDKPQLVVLTRVLSVNIIINAFGIVQRSRLTINLDFKTIAKVNVISAILGGLTAIIFAYKGFKVWALVIQISVRSVTSILLLWILSGWTPSFIFSRHSFNKLFGFGSKLLLSELYSKTFLNIYNITIGKAYSVADLGFYTKAKGFVELASETLAGVLHQVTYPIMSSIQNQKERMIYVYQRLLSMTAFIILPTLTLIALLADPLVRLLLTDKWAPSIELLQWLCFARIVNPISMINLNILRAIGRSDLYLIVNISKSPIVILALIITVPYGLKAIVVGSVIASWIGFFINAYMPGKLFGYGALKQLRDMTPVICATAIMAMIVVGFTFFLDNLLLKISVGISVGIFSYFMASHLLRIKEFKEFKTVLLRILR